MTDKIINFLEAAKTDEILPIEMEATVKHLQGIPSDVLQEFISIIDGYMEDITALKQVLITRDRPNLQRYYLDALTKDQYANLSRVALYLASQEPQKMIKELLEAGFKIVTPTQESIKKSWMLIAQLKKLTKLEQEKLVNISKYATVLSDVTIVLQTGDEFENVAFNYLSKFTESDLDKLLKIEKKSMKVIK